MKNWRLMRASLIMRVLAGSGVFWLARRLMGSGCSIMLQKERQAWFDANDCIDMGLVSIDLVYQKSLCMSLSTFVLMTCDSNASAVVRNH
jgi:hypothetical protein